LKIRKGLSKSGKSKKTRQYNGKQKKNKEKTIIYKTLHRH
jgi:hypothetical protein